MFKLKNIVNKILKKFRKERKNEELTNKETNYIELQLMVYRKTR